MAPYIESIDSQEESYFVVWVWLRYIALVETCVVPFLVLTQKHKNQDSVAWLLEAHSFFSYHCASLFILQCLLWLLISCVGPQPMHGMSFHNFDSNLISVLEISFLCSNNIWIIHCRLLEFSLHLWKLIRIARWISEKYIYIFLFQIRSLCDILRVRWESTRSRTKQRALLMMENLVSDESLIRLYNLCSKVQIITMYIYECSFRSGRQYIFHYGCSFPIFLASRSLEYLHVSTHQVFDIYLCHCSIYFVYFIVWMTNTLFSYKTNIVCGYIISVASWFSLVP
jgi:hypothetical protein